MDDLSLRNEFRRALDAVAPPAPWLAANVRTELQAAPPRAGSQATAVRANPVARCVQVARHRVDRGGAGGGRRRLPGHPSVRAAAHPDSHAHGGGLAHVLDRRRRHDHHEGWLAGNFAHHRRWNHVA